MSSRQKAACATAGLVCAFGGIWSIDAHVAALSGTPYTTLWMRIVSLCVYLVACAIAIREPSIFDGNGETARKRAAHLIACSTACLFISLAGSLGFIYGAKGALALACGFAMKLFGAPLTIALVCCYSRIKKADSTKASLIGISGAFVAQSILSSINVQQLWHPLIGICAGFALCAVAIICIAALLCTEGPEAAHAPSGTQVAKSQPNESRNQLPLRNVFTGPFLAILVSTSFMLGFLRSGLQTNDVLSASPFIAIALVAFCVLLIPTDAHVSLSNLLSVGLACVAAAFLVAPLIDSTVPDCQTILATLGTTVLEAAAWAMAASAARQSRKTLVAAAFARLCVALGHLLGALIARSMLVLSNADASAIQAGSLVVIFVYFMVALFLGRASTEAFVQIEKGSIARETDSRVAAIEETATLIGMGNNTCGRNENEASQERGDHTHAELPQKPFAPIKAQTSTTSHMEFDAICDDRTECALEAIAHTCQLTPREIEVFRLLSLGRDIATIENDLCISRNTAKMHIRHVYQKLEVHSKQELIDLVRPQ